METAKVDIRKLQVLNDRINQCIDALNQVRLSVHGLAAGQGQATGIGPAGLSHTSFAQTPFAGMGIASPISAYGQAALGAPYVGAPFTPFSTGLAHTTSFAPQVPGVGAINPFAGFAPEAYEVSLRPLWADPLLTARIQQTFPYAQLPVPPVVTIY